MAYVIAEPCAACKHGACVTVCPVDAIHSGVVEKDGNRFDQLFINPDDCISCGLCETECPVDAICEDSLLPEQWRSYAEINAAFYSQN